MRRAPALTLFALAAFALVAPPASAATLSGRVVQDDSDAPLASVDVRLSKTGQPRLVADLDTDVSGNFAVADLTPGDYRLVLSKPNFIGVTLEFKIGAADKVADQFRLIRGAAISGQVTDSSGRPVTSGFVYAMAKPAEGDSFRPMTAPADAREDVRLAKAESRLLRGQTEANLHSVGQFPAEDETAEPVYKRPSKPLRMSTASTATKIFVAGPSPTVGGTTTYNVLAVMMVDP